MPFSHASGDGAPDGGLRQFWDRADAAGDEAVEKAIFEAGEERGCEVVAGEQEMRGAFACAGGGGGGSVGFLCRSEDDEELTLAVNQDTRVSSVGAEKHGFFIGKLFCLSGGCALGGIVDAFEKLFGRDGLAEEGEEGEEGKKGRKKKKKW